MTPPTINVVSFPKSGRTWVELMMRRIASSLTGLDLAALLRGDVSTLDAPNACVPHVVFGHGVENGALCRDGVFCHRTYDRQRVALLVRDPRDVLISHYYYERFHHQRFDGSLEEFIDHPYRQEPTNSPACRYGLEPILNYLNGWSEHRRSLLALHLVSYERCRVDPVAEIASLCDFIGVPASRPVIVDAVEFASVENMRRYEDEGGFGWHGLRGSDDQRGKKVRKAVVGGYREQLSGDMIARIDRVIDARLSPDYAAYRSAARAA